MSEGMNNRLRIGNVLFGRNRDANRLPNTFNFGMSQLSLVVVRWFECVLPKSKEFTMWPQPCVSD
jgi:hypothetical protein